MRLVLALTVLLLGPGVLAQEACVFCKGVDGVRSIDYCDGAHPVCSRCARKLPRCQLCRNPTDAAVHRDGRLICQFCRKTGVFDQKQLDRIYTEVQQFVKVALKGIQIQPPPPVQLVDKDELQTKFTEGGRSMDVGGFYRPYNPEMIYVLTGYQPLECAATMVHEYTHAWQSRNCTSQDRAVTEGFASWVEYKYLMSRGERSEAEQLKRKSNPDYGEALLKFLELEKKLGTPGVIKFARESPKF
ncbi:MAG: hypothetical protein HY319_24470 [Armatimonadetes bacterium]|nr:hypothetical protein [Armatimonadota bacterium]